MTRDLVVRARKGDHYAFAVLAGAAISRLSATAWLMLRDRERATDAVQNALVRAWRDLPTLRDPDRFDAWVHRLLVNACIDEIRRVRRRPFEVDVDVTDLNLPLPPPFGPARNGLIVYGGSDHDIHALDPATGATTSLIAGTEGDHRPCCRWTARRSSSFETRRRSIRPAATSR
jgi:DNA-directed RNA polymerase specialized sigma24 family protein